MSDTEAEPIHLGLVFDPIPDSPAVPVAPSETSRKRPADEPAANVPSASRRRRGTNPDSSAFMRPSFPSSCCVNGIVQPPVPACLLQANQTFETNGGPASSSANSLPTLYRPQVFAPQVHAQIAAVPSTSTVNSIAPIMLHVHAPPVMHPSYASYVQFSQNPTTSPYYMSATNDSAQMSSSSPTVVVSGGHHHHGTSSSSNGISSSAASSAQMTQQLLGLRLPTTPVPYTTHSASSIESAVIEMQQQQQQQHHHHHQQQQQQHHQQQQQQQQQQHQHHHQQQHQHHQQQQQQQHQQQHQHHYQSSHQQQQHQHQQQQPQRTNNNAGTTHSLQQLRDEMYMRQWQQIGLNSNSANNANSNNINSNNNAQWDISSASLQNVGYANSNNQNRTASAAAYTLGGEHQQPNSRIEVLLSRVRQVAAQAAAAQTHQAQMAAAAAAAAAAVAANANVTTTTNTTAAAADTTNTNTAHIISTHHHHHNNTTTITTNHGNGNSNGNGNGGGGGAASAAAAAAVAAAATIGGGGSGGGINANLAAEQIPLTDAHRYQRLSASQATVDGPVTFPTLVSEWIRANMSDSGSIPAYVHPELTRFAGGGDIPFRAWEAAVLQIFDRMAPQMNLMRLPPKGMPKSEIEQLKSFRLMDPSVLNEKVCVVCQCDFEKRDHVRVLPCDHHYHVKCVDKWLKTNRTCPICRKSASDSIDVGIVGSPNAQLSSQTTPHVAVQVITQIGASPQPPPAPLSPSI